MGKSNDRQNFREYLKVLVIDPDDQIPALVSSTFAIRWPECIVVHATDGKAGLALIERELPDLVLTEMVLPDTTGVEIIKQIRFFSDVPIAILCGKERDELLVARGLDVGADDCIFKPPSPIELIARASAVLRRSGNSAPAHDNLPPFVTDDLTVDFRAKRVFIGGEQIHLTPTEYLILCQLVRNSGRVVSLDTLRHRVWGKSDNLSSGAIRKSVSLLRRKLGNHRDTNTILTERGFGYRFVGERHPSHEDTDSLIPE